MNRDKVIIRTSIIGICGNIVLVGIKAFIGFLVGSIAIILDAVNNLSDALSSIITIIGTKLSSKKPDKKHPFGYGRIEYITSMVISIIVMFAGVSALRESITTLIDLYQNGTMPSYNNVALIIISIGVVVKVGLGLYFMKMGKKVQSENLKASGKDALMDSILSLSTLVGAIICMFTKVSIEGYLGIVISLFILKAGMEILRDALSEIIGKRSDPELTKEIKAMVNRYDIVKGSYDLILNSYGPEKIIGSIHVEVKDNTTAKEIHQLTRQIQIDCKMKYNIIMTVGVYASNESNPEIFKIKTDLNKILHNYKEVLQMHGFYVEEQNHIITFDLIFDLSVKEPEKLKQEIVRQISELYPSYHFDAILDADFTD